MNNTYTQNHINRSAGSMVPKHINLSVRNKYHKKLQ